VAQPWDPLRMTTGLYMYGAHLTKSGLRILYHKDGMSCTVSVTEHAGGRQLRVNGKIDASSQGDMCTQLMAAHLPMLLNPGAKNVFVLGLGSGVTLGGVCRYEVNRIDCAEIEGRVVEAVHFFDAFNHEPLKDPRVRMLIDDGRNVIRHARRPYDVIISEPSNPWIAGIADLFTREFFLDCRGALATNGVMCQWLHTYNLAYEDYMTIARTFAGVFDYHAVYDITKGDTMLIGSRQRLTPDFQRLGQLIASNALLRADLRTHCGGADPYGIFIRYFAVDDSAYDLACGNASSIITEAHNTLGYSAARALYSDKDRSDAITTAVRQNQSRALPGDASMPLLAEQEYTAAVIAAGNKLAAAGNFAGAFHVLSPLGAYATNDTALQVACVRAAVFADSTSSASNTLSMLFATAPADANDLVCWLVDRGDSNLAYYAASTLHDLYPESVVASVNLGAVLANRGRWEDARTMLQQALERDPLNVQARERLRTVAPEER